MKKTEPSLRDGIPLSAHRMVKDRLITPGYCLILAANFLLYFGFYLVLPVLPFYLTENFHASGTQAGVILSCYTLAALTIRPFSGYLLDTFARKPLYLLSFFVFTAVFAGYIWAASLTAFVLLRVLHGLSFGTVTVSGNTLVIDVMPSSRRGEGLGYYGLANNIAMSVGPMTGLFLHDHHSFRFIFACALISCGAGCLIATFVKAPRKPPVPREKISLDRFFLVKGIPAGIDLVLLSIPYGMTSTYIAMYAKQLGITRGSGLFFTFMAVGTAVSRIFSGRQVDKGRLLRVISVGMTVVAASYLMLSLCMPLSRSYPDLVQTVFYGNALLLGTGFGTMFPAFNTLFVNLAPNNKRGTATSTYLTSWDVGIGIGLTLGGFIGQHRTMDMAYLAGAVLIAVSFILFTFGVGPHYRRNKLR